MSRIAVIFTRLAQKQGLSYAILFQENERFGNFTL